MAKEQHGDHFDFVIEADPSVGLISEGIQPLKCVGVKTKKASSGDGQTLQIIFESMTKDEQGRRVFMHVGLGEASRWKLTEVLLAFGIETTKDSKGRLTARLTPEAFMGQRVRGRIAHDPYNGELRAQVEQLMPWDAPTKKDADEDEPAPRRSRASVMDDDDDDPPARSTRRAKDVDDDDDPPVSRRAKAKDEEEEEDDPPPRRTRRAKKEEDSGNVEDDLPF